MSIFPLFFFHDPATTEIYTLSLHDALPISSTASRHAAAGLSETGSAPHALAEAAAPDRKSTRLNSSHTVISYAVFCLKKKNIGPLGAGNLGNHVIDRLRAPVGGDRHLYARK